jgi:hypothetical protein
VTMMGSPQAPISTAPHRQCATCVGFVVVMRLALRKA